MKILRCICIALLLSNLNVLAQTWEEVNTLDFGSIYHTVFNQKGDLLAFAKHHGDYLSPETGKTWEIIGSDFSAGASAGWLRYQAEKYFLLKRVAQFRPSFSSGINFYQLNSVNVISSVKMVVLK